MKRVLFGMILIFLIMQNASSSESMANSMIDDNFIAWSNSIPKEEAEIQLKDFLSSFDSWGEAKKWLISKNLKIEGPLLMREAGKRHYGIDKNSAFTVGAVWSSKKQGIIFASNWLLKLESKLFVHGVSIGFSYSEEPFIVHHVNITETRL